MPAITIPKIGFSVLERVSTCLDEAGLGSGFDTYLSEEVIESITESSELYEETTFTQSEYDVYSNLENYETDGNQDDTSVVITETITTSEFQMTELTDERKNDGTNDSWSVDIRFNTPTNELKAIHHEYDVDYYYIKPKLNIPIEDIMTGMNLDTSNPYTVFYRIKWDKYEYTLIDYGQTYSDKIERIGDNIEDRSLDEWSLFIRYGRNTVPFTTEQVNNLFDETTDIKVTLYINYDNTNIRVDNNIYIDMFKFIEEHKILEYKNVGRNKTRVLIVTDGLEAYGERFGLYTDSAYRGTMSSNYSTTDSKIAYFYNVRLKDEYVNSELATMDANTGQGKYLGIRSFHNVGENKHTSHYTYDVLTINTNESIYQFAMLPGEASMVYADSDNIYLYVVDTFPESEINAYNARYFDVIPKTSSIPRTKINGSTPYSICFYRDNYIYALNSTSLEVYVVDKYGRINRGSNIATHSFNLHVNNTFFDNNPVDFYYKPLTGKLVNRKFQLEIDIPVHSQILCNRYILEQDDFNTPYSHNDKLIPLIPYSLTDTNVENYKSFLDTVDNVNNINSIIGDVGNYRRDIIKEMMDDFVTNVGGDYYNDILRRHYKVENTNIMLDNNLVPVTKLFYNTGIAPQNMTLFNVDNYNSNALPTTINSSQYSRCHLVKSGNGSNTGLVEIAVKYNQIPLDSDYVSEIVRINNANIGNSVEGEDINSSQVQNIIVDYDYIESFTNTASFLRDVPYTFDTISLNDVSGGSRLFYLDVEDANAYQKDQVFGTELKLIPHDGHMNDGSESRITEILGGTPSHGIIVKAHYPDNPDDEGTYNYKTGMLLSDKIYTEWRHYPNVAVSITGYEDIDRTDVVYNDSGSVVRLLYNTGVLNVIGRLSVVASPDPGRSVSNDVMVDRSTGNLLVVYHHFHIGAPEGYFDLRATSLSINGGKVAYIDVTNTSHIELFDTYEYVKFIHFNNHSQCMCGIFNDTPGSNTYVGVYSPSGINIWKRDLDTVVDDIANDPVGIAHLPEGGVYNGYVPLIYHEVVLSNRDYTVRLDIVLTTDNNKSQNFYYYYDGSTITIKKDLNLGGC